VAPIELTEVSAGYGGDAVIKSTTIRVDHGITLLAAPNGAGKTTFLRLCAGILHAESGRVSVLGGDPYASAGVRARIGYLSHQVGLEPRLTVAENLEFWARMRGLGPARRREVVGEVIDELDLGGLASSRAGALSRGQRQRATLARTLLGRPELLLLDEPATGLDPGWYGTIAGILERQVREDGVCVLLASHDPRDHAAGWQVLEISDGVIRGRPMGDQQAVTRYEVRVASPVRILQRGPWQVEYQPGDEAAMTVTLTAPGALAGFVAALDEVSATVVSIRLLRPSSDGRPFGAGNGAAFAAAREHQ
jgi:ABC-type multidrug transport system ATPase subunit